MDIDKIIENGENSFTEFKNENFHSDSLAKEITAFLNFQGGSVFVGIDDNGNISGVSLPSLEVKIVNICRNNIIPSVIPELINHKVGEEIILEIRVDQGFNRPYKVKSSNKFYIRAGSVSIEPTNEELIRLFQKGNQLHYEVSSVMKSALDDIDFVKFRDYCIKYRDIEFDIEDAVSLMKNLDLVADNHLTVVGMLFFGNRISRFLPQAGIELNCFAGKELDSDVLDHNVCSDDIPNSIKNAQEFVRNHSQIRFKDTDSLERKDIYDYDAFVVRELLVNAFSHRDWSIFGQKIRLNLFQDRFELFSPGGFPNTLKLESALHGVSYYRNPISSQILRDYKLAEKMGRGLYKIYKKKLNHLLDIEFIVEPELVKVIVYKNK
jgi:ATP-dependent DNA helicase RecG